MFVSHRLRLFFRPSASKRLALGCNLPEVIRPALGILFAGKPASFGEYEFTWYGFIAMRAFHVSDSTTRLAV